MFNCIIKNGKRTELYYHKTDGGAEYLTKELNGNRIGSAYESYICLAM